MTGYILPMPELLPIDQWHVPIAGTTQINLREPTGEPYDPNTIPPWFSRTGVDYLQANPDQVKLTFFFNMQRTAADLGPPGEFEEQIQTATIIGDRFLPPGYRRDNSYIERFAEGIGSRPMPVFDTGNPTNPTTATLVGGIRDSFLRRLKSNDEPDRALELLADSEATRREKIIKGVASAIFMHVIDWAILDAVGTIAAHREGPQYAIVSLKPVNLDLVRKTAMLDLTVDARRIGEDNWPIEVVREAHHVQSTLETGMFNTAEL